MRTAGVLMPIPSLPSKYGIGTMGKEAYKFIDFLEKGGQTLWQILPVNPTGFGDSPYQSFCTYAGNPYFIDLELLIEDSLLTRKEVNSFAWGENPEYIEYGTLYNSRYPVLRKAHARFVKNVPEDYAAFCEEHAYWLDNYALYMAIKNDHKGQPWYQWEDGLKLRKASAIKKAMEKLAEDVDFYKMLQYLFFKQWNDMKFYANSHGILIVGDIPIYVSLDSADVWSNPKQFQMDKNLQPTGVAGCPPDAFSADGQLWGNPLYNWAEMKKDHYKWWTSRVKAMSAVYDIIRMDHFRGFESYWNIPFGDDNAKRGKWEPGPGIELFDCMEKELGTLPIIVEDLGTLTDDVRQLLKDCGYPGMKVLQFAFDSGDSVYMPHLHIKHCVIYTGTHDNDTTLGWLENCPAATRERVIEYLNLTKKEGFNWGLMRAAWSSVADIAIVPMNDLLGLGSEARINEPSTTGKNWKWRMKAGATTDALAEKLYSKMKLYGRLPEEDVIDEEDLIEEQAAAEKSAEDKNSGEKSTGEKSTGEKSIEEKNA